jgi:hypothetical protein
MAADRPGPLLSTASIDLRLTGTHPRAMIQSRKSGYWKFDVSVHRLRIKINTVRLGPGCTCAKGAAMR